MGSVINTNVPSLVSQRFLNVSARTTEKAMQKLSSGLRINSAADDAAGLAISEKMRGQIRGLQKAARNAQDSTSLIQVTEGALDQTHAMLLRLRELAVQSSNDTNTEDDRVALNNEVVQLKQEIDRIGNSTEFNTKKLLDGSMKGATEKVLGRVQVNNNSQVKIDQVAFLSSLKTIQDTNLYDGTISIVRNSEASGLADFKIIFHSEKNASGNSVAVTAFGSQGAAITAGTGTSGNGIAAISGAVAGQLTFDPSLSGAAVARAVSVEVLSNSIQITGLLSGAADVLTIALASNSASLFDMKANEAITFNFARKEEAGGNLDFSMMSQLGANGGQVTFANISDMRSRALGLENTSVISRDQAQAALAEIDNAATRVSAQRSLLGAIENRLSYTINSLETTVENVSAAESRIRDADMALEMSNFTKESVKSQAAQAMVSQANARANQILGLLQ